LTPGKKRSRCSQKNSGFIPRPVEREQNTRSAYKFQPYLKVFKNVGKKTCFWEFMGKSLHYGAFLSFFAFEGAYLQFHKTKKCETLRTCWHSSFTKPTNFRV